MYRPLGTDFLNICCHISVEGNSGLTNGKDVTQARAEGMANRILEVDDLEGARVPLMIRD